MSGTIAKYGPSMCLLRALGTGAALVVSGAGVELRRPPNPSKRTHRAFLLAGQHEADIADMLALHLDEGVSAAPHQGATERHVEPRRGEAA